MLVMDLPEKLLQLISDNIPDIIAFTLSMAILFGLIALLLLLFPNKPWHSGGIKPRM